MCDVSCVQLYTLHPVAAAAAAETVGSDCDFNDASTLSVHCTLYS